MSDPDGRIGNGQAGLVRQLQEMIAALDRRVPQEGRVGESAIAEAAAALRAAALKRLDELEREALRPMRSGQAR